MAAQTIDDCDEGFTDSPKKGKYDKHFTNYGKNIKNMLSFTTHLYNT